MPPYGYSEEEINEALSRGELSAEEADVLLTQSMDAPGQKEKSSLFNFLNKILEATRAKLSKVSNLHDNEITSLKELRSGAVYAEIMDLPIVATFFHDECDHYLALCDSRKGFLIDAAITQKKLTTAKAGQLTPEKKRWFGGKEE